MDELVRLGIRAVYDLELEPADSHEILSATVRNALNDKGIEYKHAVLYDGEMGQDINTIFSNAAAELKTWEEIYPHGGILVKCAAGISRSAATLITHYCLTRGMNFTEALAYINRREMFVAQWAADPNEYFRSYLKKRFGYANDGSTFRKGNRRQSI